ncbi:autoinducer binding domain-containing protein [Salmonella enterica]|nr:autoinducer binding domain-containing protein [Salmonella enterica]
MMPVNIKYIRLDIPSSTIYRLSEFVFNKTQQSRFSLLFRKVYPVTDKEMFVIDNYHDEWREVYDRKKLWCLDPVVNICRKSVQTSQTWGDTFFEGYSTLLKYGEEYGFKYGVSFIINTLHGYECILSLSNEICNITSQQLAFCEAHYIDIYNVIINSCLSHLTDMRDFKLTPPTLTTMEKIILTLVADGFTSSEIARKIFVTESTVNFHVYNIIKKLGCRNRMQIVAKAIMLNII